MYCLMVRDRSTKRIKGYFRLKKGHSFKHVITRQLNEVRVFDNYAEAASTAKKLRYYQREGLKGQSVDIVEHSSIIDLGEYNVYADVKDCAVSQRGVYDSHTTDNGTVETERTPGVCT